MPFFFVYHLAIDTFSFWAQNSCLIFLPTFLFTAFNCYFIMLLLFLIVALFSWIWPHTVFNLTALHMELLILVFLSSNWELSTEGTRERGLVPVLGALAFVILCSMCWSVVWAPCQELSPLPPNARPGMASFIPKSRWCSVYLVTSLQITLSSFFNFYFQTNSSLWEGPYSYIGESQRKKNSHWTRRG